MNRVELDLLPQGAVPPAFFRGLAAEQHTDISGVFAADGGYSFDDAAGFWRIMDRLSSLIRTPEDLGRLLRATLEDSLSGDCIYSEILISADICGGDLSAWADHLHAAREVVALAQAQGLVMRLTVAALRQSGPEAGRRAALCAAETAGGAVVGFMLTGDEGVGRVADHLWAFDCAREAGLGLTLSAGGRAGPQDLRRMVRGLGLRRIGNGRRAAEDPALVEELAEAGVVLNLWPGRDIRLAEVPGWRQHPASALYDRGARLAVSSFAPAAFGPPGQVHEQLHRAFDWDEGVFQALAETALDAAFCRQETRNLIRKARGSHA